MGLSSVAVQQREKEAKALKSFLAFSLLGSLALHIGLLASGIGNFLSRTPDLEDEPMQVVIVDPPKVEQVKPQPQPQGQQTQPSKAPVVVSPGSSRIGGQSAPPKDVEVVRKTPSPSTATRIPKPAPRVAPSPAIVAEPQPKAPQRIQKPVESVKPEPLPAQKPDPASEIAATPKPVQTPPPAASNQQLRDALAAARTARESQIKAPTSPAPPAGNMQGSPRVATGSGVSTGNTFGTGRGTSSGSGTGAGTGTGTSTSPGSGNSTQGSPQGRGRGEGYAEGTGSGRLACRECGKPKYPESARRRGIEGSAKVKLEVDGRGNVTDVKIAQSSGNADLDEAAVRAARRWKLKNPKGGTQGVVAKVDFELEKSEQERRDRERRREREAARKKRQEEAASSPQQQQQAQSRDNSQPAVSGSESRLQRALSRPSLNAE